MSGSREFGFSQNADGSLTFYTQAIDSPTDLAGSYVGPYIQAIGWSHFMAGIGRRFGMEYRDVKKSIRMERFMNKDLEKKPVCVLPNERPPLLIKYGKSL
jgi:hypothetical protein